VEVVVPPKPLADLTRDSLDGKDLAGVTKEDWDALKREVQALKTQQSTVEIYYMSF
jgi:hypothetical protein